MKTKIVKFQPGWRLAYSASRSSICFFHWKCSHKNNDWLITQLYQNFTLKGGEFDIGERRGGERHFQVKLFALCSYTIYKH